MKSKKSRAWIWWVIVGILALSRLATATEKAEIKTNLDENTLYAYCPLSLCPAGVPLYNDLKLPQFVVANVPHKTFCEVESYYPAGSWKEKLEEENGGTFPSDSYYFVDCGGSRGWIPAEYTSRTR